MNPGCAEDPATKIYWNDKRAKLKADFEEFENFTVQLGANIGGKKGRVKWLLTHEDCAKKVLGLLAEDIDVLRALQLMMES
jgi:glutaredoxin 2